MLKGKPLERKPSNAEQALPPEQAVAKAAILAECERLAEAGITFVAVHFDGSDDEGVNDDIKCFATDDYAYRRYGTCLIEKLTYVGAITVLYLQFCRSHQREREDSPI